MFRIYFFLLTLLCSQVSYSSSSVDRDELASDKLLMRLIETHRIDVRESRKRAFDMVLLDVKWMRERTSTLLTRLERELPEVPPAVSEVLKDHVSVMAEVERNMLEGFSSIGTRPDESLYEGMLYLVAEARREERALALKERRRLAIEEQKRLDQTSSLTALLRRTEGAILIRRPQDRSRRVEVSLTPADQEVVRALALDQRHVQEAMERLETFIGTCEACTWDKLNNFIGIGRAQQKLKRGEVLTAAEIEVLGSETALGI